MTSSNSIDNPRDFKRIEKAIHYIKDNFQQQPSLDEIAKHVDVSSFHFQRMFTDWAGISPKKFLQYISVNYAKQVLSDSQASLLDVSYDVGLSGTSRLHDLFINIEGMTPGEFKKGGESLAICYQFLESIFGLVLVASTDKGICYMGFVREDPKDTFSELHERFPQANFIEHDKNIHHLAAKLGGVESDKDKEQSLKLHLKGTDFQLKVWEALLKIPLGHLNTYGDLAKYIDRPKASRAVGTAIGGNPVAFLIPCHRVIRASGVSGGYMWGAQRKAAMIAWEAAQISNSKESFI